MSAIVEFEIWFLLGALFFVVVHQMLNGRINSRELLLDKDDGTVSPVRVQLLIFTLIGAGTYLALIDDPVATDNLQKMPEVPEAILAAVIGSQGVYLTRKAYLRFRKGRL